MVTVVNSAGEIAELTTGKLPERAEVVADNAARDAKDAKESGKQPAATKEPEKVPEKATEAAQDDIEGEDGLTPRQKREWTAAMLKSVGKKHREKLEAEEFAAEQYNQRRLAEQRAENLERQLAELNKQPVAKVEAPTKPERANFQTDEAYQDALVDFRVKETLAREKREEAERAAQERQQQVIQAATDRLKHASEIVPDFTEVTEAADLRVPGHIAGYMQESEMFAELGYHFAKHPEVLDRLAKLSPAKALVEVGKIESTLQPFAPSSAAGAGEKANGQKPSASETESATPSAAATEKSAGPSPKTESSQPTAGPSKSRAPVITPLNTGSAAQVDKPLDSMNTREAIVDWQRKKGVNLERRRRH